MYFVSFLLYYVFFLYCIIEQYGTIWPVDVIHLEKDVIPDIRT